MLILASQSPTRKTLLENAGLVFSTQPAQIDERALERDAHQRPSAERAVMLARAKAMEVSATHPGAYVIGADQILDWDGSDIHKPTSLEAAARQLEALSGTTHRLYSSVCLVRGGTELFAHTGVAELTLKTFSRERLEKVLALEGEAILTSVGGYRLEGPSIRLFQTVKGDYFTILGLPLLELLDALEHHAPHLL